MMMWILHLCSLTFSVASAADSRRCVTANWMDSTINVFLVRVDVTPPEVIVATLGGRAELGCVITQTAGLMDAQWLANGTALDDLSEINSTTEYFLASGFVRLILTSLSYSFNMTRITCRSIYADGHIDSNPTVILLQGRLKLLPHTS